MDPLPPFKDTTANLNTPDDKDQASGSSVDTMIVGVASVDPSIAGTTVGSLGLASDAQGDGSADVPGSGVKTTPVLGMSGDTMLGGSHIVSRQGMVASGDAISWTMGDQSAALFSSGDGSIGASSDPSVTLGNAIPKIGGVSDPGPVTASDTITTPGSGLVFVNTYDPSVTMAFQNNIITAEHSLAALFTDSITLNENFTATAAGNTGFLATNSFFLHNVSYANLKAALVANAGHSAVAASVAASLPATDPSGGAGFFLPEMYAEFLGFSVGNLIDNVTLNTSFSWNFSTDVVDTMMHEISEGGMGRVGGLGFGLGGRFSTMDLFSYNSTTFAYDTSTTDASRVFSFNGGVTTSAAAGLFYFAANSGDDAADFQELDVFGTGTPGETFNLSTTDIQEMEALGWTPPPCYCRGTRIATERGEVAVEDLAVGDRVVTISGAARAIKWIGRRAYDGRFVAGNRSILPIVVEAGALADGVPARDLFLSPEHALYLDGALAPAGLLVNGATIRQVERIDRVEYFHIELAAHDVILAEGAPAESYVDCDNRFMFQNGDEFAGLYPDNLPAPWQFCAPRVEEPSPELNAIRDALLERAAALGIVTWTTAICA